MTSGTTIVERSQYQIYLHLVILAIAGLDIIAFVYCVGG
jgi:hypothetical protein